MAFTKTVDADLAAMIAGVFAEHRERHPSVAVTGWPTELWSTLSELGLARLTAAEADGGSGASLLEAAELLRAAAACGVATPFIEHDLLAGRILADAGCAVDDARRTLCRFDDTGSARGVPWAVGADRIAVIWRGEGGDRIADLAASSVTITGGGNAAGEPRATVTVDDPSELVGAPVSAEAVDRVWFRGALARAVQVTGALETIVSLTVEHASARTQFGRPLGRFQAVQHLVADLAAETALARAAVDAAVVAAVADEDSPDTKLQIAMARSCAGHAASVVVRNAHQVHGAIGTTAEHRLHEFTRPALAWRSEYGSVQYWDRWITDRAIALGRSGLWAAVTSEPRTGVV